MGKRIIACREGFGAVIEKEDQSHEFLTMNEAGGTPVINAATAQGLPTIEKVGWEKTVDPGTIGVYTISWVAVGSWDPFCKKLPKVICHLLYHDDNGPIQNFAQLPSLRRLFGATIYGIIAESICGNNALSVEEALQQVFGVSHEERVRQWTVAST